MHSFPIKPNEYLNQKIKAFYHTNYIGYKKQGNPDYLNHLKNTFANDSERELNDGDRKLGEVLLVDFPRIIDTLKLDSLLVCVVPRAKPLAFYESTQLMFKSKVKSILKQLNGFSDGTDCIIRHTCTKTTHLQNAFNSGRLHDYDNSGAMPYPGITTQTCYVSNFVKGKDVLLVDDIYTKSVNIDEDAIQALLTKGAKSVTFYAIAYTV